MEMRSCCLRTPITKILQKVVANRPINLPGAMKQKGLLALKCWIQEHTQSEVHVDSLLCVDFNQQTKRVYVKKVHHLSNKKAVKVSIPGVSKDEEWVSFETGMIEYFKAHTVSNGIQMHYMLCDDKAAPALNVI